MDWADEHYVKLFTRDTVTWKLWPWQAKCLLPLLERKVDAAGFLPCGTHDPAMAVAAVVEIPTDVVRPGLDAMIATGTVELVDRQLLLVNFVAAQESRMTDRRKSLDYRERRKAAVRAEAIAKLSDSLNATVTARHSASPAVTECHPSAQLSSAQPSKEPSVLSTRKKPRAAKSQSSESSGSTPGSPRAEHPPGSKQAERTPDPRHIPLRTALIEAFTRKRGIPYPFDYGREDAEVRRLLKLGLEPTVLAAWERALDSSFPTISTLAKFRLEFPRFVGRGESPAAGSSRAQHVLTGLEGSGPLTATEGAV